MSRRNYTNYSHKHKHQDRKVVPEVTPVEPIDAPEIELVEETVETVPVEIVEGVVKCARLNVRANPSMSAEVLCVLSATSEIEINIRKSTDEWFHICTASGIEGYSMRKFIDAYL